ncbi:MAG TPA: UrcA family protein [Brevundimonas sp.]|jgi:UrcA family protein|uniref:UrcA family protein n=1 Tax=Brevundimonas sp. TaxID=1871086 RepID=UPI002E11A8FC|nr:UrcA family protein [Brevundimonas sp.]
MMIAALAVLATLSAAPVAPPAEAPRDAIRISTADLPAGAARGEELARRIDAAVSDYCRASSRVGPGLGQQAFCRDAVRRFVEAHLPEPVRADVRTARR